jgi:plasmid maintenance system antidote protein VapI
MKKLELVNQESKSMSRDIIDHFKKYKGMLEYTWFNAQKEYALVIVRLTSINIQKRNLKNQVFKSTFVF